MNIAFLLRPKSDVAFLYDDYSLRQGLEKMNHHGYTAIPVIDREGRYVTTISEGDILWFLIGKKGEGDYDLREVSARNLEDIKIKDVFHPDKNPPVKITATTKDLILRATEQNFIPVIDDSESFIGIVTRADVIKHLAR
jgi:CBS domain-containing protein